MADLQDLFARRAAAWAQRDPKALAATYTDDATVNSPMFPHAEGRDAIEMPDQLVEEVTIAARAVHEDERRRHVTLHRCGRVRLATAMCWKRNLRARS